MIKYEYPIMNIEYSISNFLRANLRMDIPYRMLDILLNLKSQILHLYKNDKTHCNVETETGC